MSKISNEEIDWQFKEGWNTIGALLSHIIAIEHFFRIEFVEGRKLTLEEKEKWLPGMDMEPYLPGLIQNLPLEAYIEALTQSRNLMIHALENISFEEFTKRIEEYNPVSGCNLAWALYHIVEDEIYHRGQISMIRKLYKETSL
jgi:hypothetical protein